ncbi:hypothetical protein PR048_009725 [Dryococelus australis]|uniref:DUF4209 domain-containing protein n=1 Tax=Dryococelus australis TaxID=614101 RepID=A0ABQ9I0Q6_9NEOP|nr:hypothetical protein PR048_009725 [Dryococelus australis]
MQILFGTPLCLNLRNIVWHGFPSPEELQPHFAIVLIVLMASLGEVLQSKGFSVSSLPSRPQVSNLHQLSSALDGCFPDLTIYHKETVEVFRNCHFIAPSHKATWDVILQHYINSR